MGLSLDQKLFIKMLNEVKGIQNKVMRFNPNGLVPVQPSRACDTRFVTASRERAATGTLVSEAAKSRK